MERELKIVFCVPGKQFSNQFLVSWSETLLSFTRAGHKLFLSNQYSPIVYYARNQCLGGSVIQGTDQKPFQGKVDYDYIIWVDSDMVFTPQQVARAIEHLERDYSKHIIGGACLSADNTTFTILDKGQWNFNSFVKNKGNFVHMKRDDLFLKKDELFEVDYCGLGFMCMRKGVFEALEYPWFKPLFYDFQLETEDESGNKVQRKIQDFCSEDVAFCRSVIEKGYSVWVDPLITIGHEKSQVLQFPHQSVIQQLKEQGRYNDELSRVGQLKSSDEQQDQDARLTRSIQELNTIEETEVEDGVDVNQ